MYALARSLAVPRRLRDTPAPRRYVTLDDGMELTTTVASNGMRMYMDWDSQEWRELPEEWLGRATVKTDFRRGKYS